MSIQDKMKKFIAEVKEAGAEAVVLLCMPTEYGEKAVLHSACNKKGMIHAAAEGLQHCLDDCHAEMNKRRH